MNYTDIKYAPIIIFAFNRLDSLKACISALQSNSESLDSDLVVYVDGARSHKQGEEEQVQSVRDYVKTIKGFKSLTYHFSENNKGLGSSVIAGVTEVINQYGKAIVIEDDLIVGKNLLSFMNQGLDLYENNKDVFSVCGHTNVIKIPKDYLYDAYFCVRTSSWGWATWKDRWNSCDWELRDWSIVKKNARAFCKWGGSDLYGMLKAWKEGRNQSWAIRFGYNQFIQNKLSLFPIISHIDNKGFDGSGTNCKSWSRFKTIFDETNNKTFKFPKEISMNKIIYKSFLGYHTVLIRIYSRVMYAIYDIKNKYNI